MHRLLHLIFELATWLLSAFLVAIIGLGTCAGGAALSRLYSEPGNLH